MWSKPKALTGTAAPQPPNGCVGCDGSLAHIMELDSGCGQLGARVDPRSGISQVSK